MHTEIILAVIVTVDSRYDGTDYIGALHCERIVHRDQIEARFAEVFAAYDAISETVVLKDAVKHLGNVVKREKYTAGRRDGLGNEFPNGHFTYLEYNDRSGRQYNLEITVEEREVALVNAVLLHNESKK